MTGKVLHAGSWKEIKEVKVNVGGTWKDANETWVKHNGVWQKLQVGQNFTAVWAEHASLSLNYDSTFGHVYKALYTAWGPFKSTIITLNYSYHDVGFGPRPPFSIAARGGNWSGEGITKVRIDGRVYPVVIDYYPGDSKSSPETTWGIPPEYAPEFVSHYSALLSSINPYVELGY